MSCLTFTPPTLPTLPSGITLSPPALPSLPNLGLCCKINLPPLPLPNIPVQIITSAQLAFVNAVMVAAQMYIDQVAANLFDCPLD